MLVLVALVALAACGGDDDDDDLSRADDQAAQEERDDADEDAANDDGANDDGEDDVDTTDSSGPATGSDAPGGSSSTVFAADDDRCREVQVVLKPEITDDQRDAVEEKLKGIDEVDSYRFEAAESDAEPSSFFVVPTSEDQQGPVGSQFDGMDGVVSVIYPNQVC